MNVNSEEVPINLTATESKLILRYRKKLHFAFSLIRNIFACIGIILLIVIIILGINKQQKSIAFNQKLSEAKEDIANTSLPNNIIPVSKLKTYEEISNSYLAVYTAFLDSAKLSSDIRGFRVNFKRCGNWQKSSVTFR